MFKILLFALILCFAMSNKYISAEDKRTIINNITVKNNQRIDTETIISYLNLEKGDQVNYQILNKKLKELYKLGLFADIKFRVKNNNLIVTVKENPMLNSITFTGNKRIKDDIIQSEISIKPRNVFKQEDLNQTLDVIREIYKRSGYFSAKFKTDISKLSQNRVDVDIRINEGTKTKIKGIKFIGNEKFSDTRLKGVITTKESKLWRFFSAGDVYDPDRINYDKDLLRRYYLKEGYADFNIKSAFAELTKDKKGFFITYSIEEGKRYKFGDVKISIRGDKKVYDINEIKKITDPLIDSNYDIERLDNAIQDIKVYGGNLGFAFMVVRPGLKKNKTDRKIDITINISESNKVYVNRINIKGNTRTQDRVIRREFRFNEGDSFTNEKLDRSRQRVLNTGFFEKVDIEKKASNQKDRTDLNVLVSEKQTGQFSIGGGFSSSNGALANVGIAEQNFLGKGQDVRLKFTLSERTNEIDASFTEPYLFEKNMAAGFDLFKNKTTYADESSYDNDSVGTAFRLGYMITERTRHAWNYTFKKESIEGVKTGASEFITNQKGDYTTSVAGHTLSFFGINDRLNPTGGSQWKLSNRLAGLGGNVSYFKSKFNYTWYYQIGEGYIWVTDFKGGYVFGFNDDDVNLKDRFFLGGDSFPGFEPAGVGPRDTSSANKDSLGGNLMYTGTAELKVPIPGVSPQLGISGAFFTTVGAATEIDENKRDKIKDESTPRVTAGFGVEWKSPFGPVRLDFAHAVKKEEFDRTQFFKFNFGARF